MAIIDAIRSFMSAHTNVLQEIEKMALHDIVKLLKDLYPNDPVITTIVAKISDEVLRLQGIDPAA